MERWICTICQYVYDPATGDPDRGIPAGTPFESLPDDWPVEGTTGYEAYGELEFKPVVFEGGDCYARCKVRLYEMLQSIALMRGALDKLPEGPLAVPVKGNPDGETISRCEQPRGEVIYYMRANNTRNLERLRIRTPTFANLAPLLKMLPGCQLADVPVIVLAIDPCISCTER